jgi:hypothetical protein
MGLVGVSVFMRMFGRLWHTGGAVAFKNTLGMGISGALCVAFEIKK